MEDIKYGCGCLLGERRTKVRRIDCANGKRGIEQLDKSTMEEEDFLSRPLITGLGLRDHKYMKKKCCSTLLFNYNHRIFK